MSNKNCIFVASLIKRLSFLINTNRNDMMHQLITIEYPLSTKSPNIIWDMISTSAGLQKWIADYVEDTADGFSFTWGEPWTQQDTKISHILESEKFSRIRLKWDDQEEGDFWEMRIEKSELTGKLSLIIIDHAEEDDVDYIKEVWDKNLNRLHTASGL